MPFTEKFKKSKAENNQQILRPLGNNECYQLARYVLDQYRGTSVTCRYTIPCELKSQDKNAILISAVNGAIFEVIRQSPTLQVGIIRENSKNPAWIHLEKVEISKHVEWIYWKESTFDEQRVQDVIISQLDRRFFPLNERPGWRTIVMQHYEQAFLDIMFVYNHPHADGMSGRIFHELLLQKLFEASLIEPCLPVDELKVDFADIAKRFPPATEELVNLPVTTGYALKTLWHETKPLSLFEDPTEAKWAPMLDSSYKSGIVQFSIENAILAEILHKCRLHKVTLTCLLNGLILVTLASHLDKVNAPAFASSTAIDQWRYLPKNQDRPWFEPKEAIGNHVTTMTHVYDCQTIEKIRSGIAASPSKETLSSELLEMVWSVATKVQKEIKDRLELGLKNDLIGLAKFIPNWQSKFKQDIKKTRKLSWFTTNLGIIAKAPNQGNGTPAEWSISRAQFTLSTELPVAALLVGIMSTGGGELTVTCTWQDKVVERQIVENVMADLRNWLVFLGGCT